MPVAEGRPQEVSWDFMSLLVHLLGHQVGKLYSGRSVLLVTAGLCLCFYPTLNLPHLSSISRNEHKLAHELKIVLNVSQFVVRKLKSMAGQQVKQFVEVCAGS